MALSTILEMNARLLTGLKFCFISSKPIFFNNGLTTAVFHLVLYSPLVSDVLTILVISGPTTGRIFFSIFVGMSSNSQVLDFICLIIRDICFSVIGANFLSSGTDESVIASYCFVPLNNSLIFKILFLKKVAKSSVRSSFVLCFGHFCGSGLLVRLFTKVKSFLNRPNNP